MMVASLTSSISKRWKISADLRTNSAKKVLDNVRRTVGSKHAARVERMIFSYGRDLTLKKRKSARTRVYEIR